MKQLSIILGLLMLGCQGFCADIEQPTQVIEIEKSGAVAILQKQPANEKQTQLIRVKKAGGFLLIQINGKIKDTDINLQNR